MKIAFCGLDCEVCEAFKATKTNDDALRAKIAAEWAKQFGHSIQPEEINCVGCVETGKHIGYCEGICEIRKCARAKSLATCADCHELAACPHLAAFFKLAPQAKANLESLRAPMR